jgi:hypothetical protein
MAVSPGLSSRHRHSDIHIEIWLVWERASGPFTLSFLFRLIFITFRQGNVNERHRRGVGSSPFLVDKGFSGIQRPARTLSVRRHLHKTGCDASLEVPFARRSSRFVHSTPPTLPANFSRIYPAAYPPRKKTEKYTSLVRRDMFGPIKA